MAKTTKCLTKLPSSFCFVIAYIPAQLLVCLCFFLTLALPLLGMEKQAPRIEHAFELMKDGKNEAALLEANLVPLSSCNIQQKLLRFEVLAESKYQLERYRDSLRDFDQLIRTRKQLLATMNKSHPSTELETRLLSMSYIHKGKALIRLGKLQDSLECVNDALKLQPDNSSALSDRAKLLVKLGRPTEALPDINKIIEKLDHEISYSKSAAKTYGSRAALIEFLYLRSEAYRNLGRFKDAESDRKKGDFLTRGL